MPLRRIVSLAAFAALALAVSVGVTVPVLRSQPQAAPSDPMQGPANPSPFYVATFVDLMPPNIVAGNAAIRQYVQDTRKDPGIQSCEAIAQVAGRANHLIVMEVWQDRAAYLKHETAAHTKDFKTKLLPLIGAPLDEREHFLLQ